jgi:tRNA pseudouridine38-40 synthase
VIALSRFHLVGTMRNIRLTIAYDGTDFHGWQRQLKAPTIQSCLEAALEKIVGSAVKVVASGRTDAGVHATKQVANFKTSSPIPCPNLVQAINNMLPATVRVKEADEVPDEFHARYAVRSKTYRYRILQARVCSPFIARFVYHYPYPLDRGRMAEAARLIEGRHDFASFAGACAAHEDVRLESSPSTEREIFTSHIFWRARTLILGYQVCGNGFLHHMVRNIVGTLIEVGRGTLEPGDMARILEACNRALAGPTAPAQGLCLMGVEY